jgi:hypothetical protein
MNLNQINGLYLVFIFGVIVAIFTLLVAFLNKK